MIVDDIFVANLDGESKFILKIKNNPNIFGQIEKEYNKDKTKFTYSIKYYWNKVLQDKLYADDIDAAKEKLKNALRQVLKQTQNVQTFEQFVNENYIQEEVKYVKESWKDPQDRGYINFINYGKNHPEYPNGLVVFNGSFVDKEFRGQGLFTELLNGFLKSIPKGTMIQVPVQNRNLRKLFIRLGFQRVKRIEYWGQLSAPNWNFQKIQD